MQSVFSPAPRLAVAALPIWARGLAALVVGEIGFYWGHRWHEIPLLWRFHSIHHNPAQVYFLISARAHPVDNVFIRLCGLIPIYILGIATPLTPSGGTVSALLVLVLTMWGFLIHANVRWRLGPLEWVIFHHWHHTLAEPRDRNYASMLPIMDRIFGTHYLPRDRWPAAYGTEAKLPGSLSGQLLYPLRHRPQIQRPGWRSGGAAISQRLSQHSPGSEVGEPHHLVLGPPWQQGLPATAPLGGETMGYLALRARQSNGASPPT